MAFDIRVKIFEIGETVEVGNNGFRKREVIGIIEGEHPETYKFEFIQDKTDLPDQLIEGTYATITFNLRGREVPSKISGKRSNYFVTLQAWKIEIK